MCESLIFTASQLAKGLVVTSVRNVALGLENIWFLECVETGLPGVSDAPCGWRLLKRSLKRLSVASIISQTAKGACSGAANTMNEHEVCAE